MQYEGFSSSPRDDNERFFGYRDRDDRSDDYYTDDDGAGFPPRAEQYAPPDINNRRTPNPDVEINKFLLRKIGYADLSEEAKRRFSACVECVEKPPVAKYNAVAVPDGAASSSGRVSSSGAALTYDTAVSKRNGPLGGPIPGTRVKVKCEDDCSSDYIPTPPLRVLITREKRNIAAGVDDPRPSNVAVDLMNRRNAESAERVLENALGISVFSFLDQIANACMGVGNKVPTWIKPKAELFGDAPLAGPENIVPDHWEKCLAFKNNKSNYLTHSDAKAVLQCKVFRVPRVGNNAGLTEAELDALSRAIAGNVQGDAEIALHATEPKVDVRVSENVASRARKVALMNRMPETLTKFADVKILTVIRESELDVWNACGGVENKLPPNTWFCRPFEPPGQTERKRKKRDRSLDELVKEFKTEVRLTVVEKTFFPQYFYEGQTFFQQLDNTTLDAVAAVVAFDEATRAAEQKAQNAFNNAVIAKNNAEREYDNARGRADPRDTNSIARANTDDRELRAAWQRLDDAKADLNIFADKSASKYALDNKFQEWKKIKSDKIPVSVVDILRMGGYGEKRILARDSNQILWAQEAADLLVARAAQTGMIDNAYPKDAMSYLLFTNDVKGDASPVTVEIQNKAVPDGLFEFVQDCFKRGKEKLLKSYCDAGRGCGGECLLVTDPEYRTAFVKLCEVNFQLREMRVGIVNDRRQKIFDLQREKREVLHSFQAKNGTARKIKDIYAQFSMTY